MYANTYTVAGLDALPSWLRDIGAKVLSNTRITVPTPFGPVELDPSDAGQVARVRDMIRGTKVSIGRPAPQPTVFDQAQAQVNKLPGGIVTVIAAAGVGFFLLRSMMRRRG